MATYPVKMLKDVDGTLFIPLTNSDSVQTSTGDTLENLISAKVDKETGKGLSTNDYTTTEKNKLAGIAAGAEVNVNANWNAVSGDAQILNKPTKVSAFTNDAGYTSNTGTVTSVGLTAGGGISISGSPITTSGSITVGHSNSITAQTTSGLYPIKIDAQGHITQYGEAYEVATTEEIKTMLQEMGLDIYVAEPISPTDYIYYDDNDVQ